MTDFLAFCSVVATGVLVSIWQQLPLGAAFSVTMIGALFTIVWLLDPINPPD